MDTRLSLSEGKEWKRNRGGKREDENEEERETEGMEAATEEASTIGQFWLGGMPCSNRDDFLASRARERVRAGATATFRALSDGVEEKSCTGWESTVCKVSSTYGAKT